MHDWLCTFGKYDPSTGECTITSSQQSLVVSILSAGTFFGALFAAPAADFLGRRWSVVLAVLVFYVGVSMQTAATALPLFVVGRVFAGLGVGMVSMLIPMYQSECSPKWIRSVSLHFACHLNRHTDRRYHQQRRRRFRLSMGHHHWSPHRRRYQQRHQRQNLSRRLAYPHRRPVHLGTNPHCWHDSSPRVSSMARQEGTRR